MRPSPKFLMIAAAVAAVALLALFFQPRSAVQKTPILQTQSASTTISVPSESTTSKQSTPPSSSHSGTASNGVVPSHATTTPIIDPTTSATLSIGGVAHTVSVSAGDTIESAMKTLQAAGVITYTTRNYQGLGTFVESINGKENGDNHYWILYVNEKKASSGISSTPIHHGDHIAWNYEQGY